MCQCASCEHTDNYSGLPDLFGQIEFWAPLPVNANGRHVMGFQAWPRGNPKGAKASSDEYKAHAKHCGSAGLPKPYRFIAGKPAQFPAWMRGNGPIEQAPRMVLDYIATMNLPPDWHKPTPKRTPYLVALARDLRKAA